MTMTTAIDSVVPSDHPFIYMIATTLTTMTTTQNIEIMLCVKFRVAIHRMMKAKSIDMNIPETADS
jgi:hypothetical protein